MEDLIVTLDNCINTSDEVRDLGLYWSFLQVLDHHVGYSSQVTHVASPGTTISPDSHRHSYYLQLKALIVRKKTQEPTEGRLTVFYRSPPRHQGSFEAVDTSGRAKSLKQQHVSAVILWKCFNVM